MNSWNANVEVWKFSNVNSPQKLFKSPHTEKKLLNKYKKESKYKI